MSFVEPIDDGIFASTGVTVKCPCGNFINISESQIEQNILVICPKCGKKI